MVCFLQFTRLFQFVVQENLIITKFILLSIRYVMQGKKIRTTAQKTVDFFKTVEAGDISLFDVFQQSIAVFGFTRVGKTSSCHYLCNSIMRSELNNGELFYKPITQKFNTAIVGHSTQSETQIPNIFKHTIKVNKVSRQIYLLDQPGYGDTYGFHRIFSNGYFHYRTFSKTPKLKFILAINKADLLGTAKDFKSTIFKFINSFSNYQSIKDQIMKATALLITKVEPKSSIAQLIKLLQSLKTGAISNLSQKQKKKFQAFLSDMIDNKKVFVIEKPAKAGAPTLENNILQQIYDKTTFWERPMQNNIADMSPINFSVAGEILNELLSFKGNQLFQQQFDHFMKYTQDRINQILLTHEYSLANIVQVLKLDAISSCESHVFLENMAKFNQTFYKFLEPFKDKRQITEANLFKSLELNDSNDEAKGLGPNAALQLRKERQKQALNIYFIKKFKVLEFIQKKPDQQSFSEEQQQRSVQYLQKISRLFIDIFKKFNILRIQKSDSQKIIYKYSYIIQRLIQEAKILSLILFNKKETQDKFDQYRQQDSDNRELVDLIRPLKDKLFVRFTEINTAELKERFINQIKFDLIDTVNKDIILFFQSFPLIDQKLQFRIANLILKYHLVLQKRNNLVSEEEKIFLVSKLYQYRNKFYVYLKNLQANNNKGKKQKQQCVEKIFLLTNSLGSMLVKFNLYQEARQVYKTINNAELIFGIFRQQIDSIDPLQNEPIRKLLMEYGEFAKYCHRTELAMQCFQQAYTRSSTYEQINDVCQAIVNVKTSSNEQTDYIKKLYTKKFCDDFSETLKTKMILLCGQNLLPIQ